MEKRISGISFHGMNRFNKRFHSHGARRGEAQITCDIKSALTAESFSGRELEYMRSLISGDRFPAVCGGRCYIMAEDGWVVTVMRLPGWFNSRPLRRGKETARSTRGFMRNRDMLGDGRYMECEAAVRSSRGFICTALPSRPSHRLRRNSPPLRLPIMGELARVCVTEGVRSSREVSVLRCRVNPSHR